MTHEHQSPARKAYWAQVVIKITKRDKRCRVCNSPRELRAHHRTYANWGNELNHLGDLTLLCSDCHEMFHAPVVIAGVTMPSRMPDGYEPKKAPQPKYKGVFSAKRQRRSQIIRQAFKNLNYKGKKE